MKIKQQWYARGFQIGHQKVFVDVDFATQTLEGWTELSIIPLSATLDSAALHCWQSEIINCEVEGHGALWRHIDGLSELQLKEDSATVHHHETLRAKFSTLNRTINKCDLHIRFPSDVKVVVQDRDDGQATHTMHNTGANEDGNEEELEVATPAVAQTPATPHGMISGVQNNPTQYKPIMVKIWFRCKQPLLGLRFGGGQYPVLYSTNHPVPCSTSLWLPCLDGIWERSTWEFAFSVPKTVGSIVRRRESSKRTNGISGTGHAALMGDEDEEEPDSVESVDALPMSVICSADFVDEETDSADPSRKILTFAQGSPVGASHMAFAVGPFESFNLSEFREIEEDDMLGSSAVDVYIHCLPPRMEDAKTTCYPLYKAMDYFVKDFGSFPYTNYELVFLEDMEVDTVSAAGLGFCSERVLYSDRMIDPIYPVTKSLVVELASQWIGVNIVPRSWTDIWLVLGLAHYIGGLFLKKLMGNNEYRYRLKQDILRLTEEDIGKPPLFSRSLEVPIDPRQTGFISLKAPVVLHMLEQRLVRAGSNLGLGRVIPRIFLQALSGELPNGILSTEKFLKQCEKMAHIKLDEFAKQWIFGHGFPRFSIAQRFNKKKMVIEMAINQLQVQDNSRPPLRESTFVDDAFRSMTQQPEGLVEAVFTGSLTIRIHEADGTPYEHIVDLKERYQKIDIPYNSKHRKRVRGRKSSKAKLMADGIEDEDNIGNDTIQCLGDGYQTEADQNIWHLEEWSNEDEENMSNESFEWIRVDAALEWICTIEIIQPDYMFHSQLQQDRDVAAQLEAVQYFSSIKATPVIATILFRTIMDDRYYYGIRQAAAFALAKADIEGSRDLCLSLLIGIFRKLYCFEDVIKVVPRANDFQDVARYLLRKSLIQAMVQIRSGGYTMPIIRSLIIDQVQHNDNSDNVYDDSHYVSLLIESLISSLIHSDPVHSPDLGRERELKVDLDKVLHEIERCQRMDRWQPSYQNTVTCAILDGKERLMQAGLLEITYKEFMSFTREEHFVSVRHQAILSMLNLGALRQRPLARYVLFVQSQDSSAYMRHQCSIMLKHGIGAMALRGKVPRYAVHTDMDAMIVEEDTTAAVELRKDRESRSTLEGALTVFREEFEDDESLKEYLWQATNDFQGAFLVRRHLLDICKIIYEPKESRILKFKLPSMKARTMCFNKGAGKIMIKKSRPLEQYQKKVAPKPVKIKLKIFNSGGLARKEVEED